MSANRSTRRRARAVARRPPARTVEVELAGEYAGWWARARADFPAALLVELVNVDASGSGIAGIVGVLDAIILEHNLPNSRDELAERMADVDPFAGLLELSGAIFDAIGKLPNR